jgi:hypothetical protein
MVSDPDFLFIPDPGVKKASDPGSGSATVGIRFPNVNDMGSQQPYSRLTKL